MNDALLDDAARVLYIEYQDIQNVNFENLFNCKYPC